MNFFKDNLQEKISMFGSGKSISKSKYQFSNYIKFFIFWFNIFILWRIIAIISIVIFIVVFIVTGIVCTSIVLTMNTQKSKQLHEKSINNNLSWIDILIQKWQHKVLN